MGEVYRAVQPEIGARVAIKVLARELSRDPRLVKRFVDEARAVNKIRHPNIIDIFAFGRLADGRQYFVMEFLEGETLAARLARGPLPVSEMRRLLVQTCEALSAAHAEQIVHRDLKPENLWIATPKHGQPYIKILDFGIAKLIEDRDASVATEAGIALGTPYYMSPEQCRGEAVDHRSDVYAMGILLYFVWSGRLPFEGQSYLAVVSQQMTAAPAPPSTHRPVPPALERLILSCLEKDPARRPQTARALGTTLEAVLAEALPGQTLPSASARSASPPPAAMPGTAAPAPGRRALRPAAIVLSSIAIAGAALAVRAIRAGHSTPVAAPAAAQPAPPAAAPPAAPAAVSPTPAPAPSPATAAPSVQPAAPAAK